MKFSDKETELFAELVEEEYQDELMLGLQTIDSEISEQQLNCTWQPDFAEIYNQLIELEDRLPYVPFISLVKH